MSERNRPVDQISFWEQRIHEAELKGDIRQAVYSVPESMWQETVKHHESIILSTIPKGSKVLDAACGYGRLYPLLHDTMLCEYLGVDVTPSFIYEAKKRYGDHFICQDILDMDSNQKFDYVVCSSLMIMLVTNKGWLFWEKIQNKLLSMSNKILCLEYGIGDTATTSNTYYIIEKK